MRSRRGVRRRTGGGGNGMGRGRGAGHARVTETTVLPGGSGTVNDLLAAGKKLVGGIVQDLRAHTASEDKISAERQSVRIEPSGKPGTARVAAVDLVKCVGCGLCVDACPAGAVYMDDKAGIDARACIGCGLCAEECPENAISLIKA